MGNICPDFSAETTKGPMPSFHKWIDGHWAILFSHPADFTVSLRFEKARAMPSFEGVGLVVAELFNNY